MGKIFRTLRYYGLFSILITIAIIRRQYQRSVGAALSKAAWLLFQKPTNRQ